MGHQEVKITYHNNQVLLIKVSYLRLFNKDYKELVKVLERSNRILIIIKHLLNKNRIKNGYNSFWDKMKKI
jgi:hypothetical protein